MKRTVSYMRHRPILHWVYIYIPSVIIFSSSCSSSSAWNPSIFSPCTYPLESVQGTCSLRLRYTCFWWLVYLYTCMCCMETPNVQESDKISTCDYILLVVNFCQIFSLHSLFILHAEKIILSLLLWCYLWCYFVSCA